ncbi:MAG: LysM peptidoglycan-binding domain-containing protein [Pseudomonadota bacterium]
MKNLLKSGYFSIALLIAVVLPATSFADEVRLTDTAPEVYLVKEGDTLWGIASLFLEDPWRWSDIWEINEQLDNPHLIFPGDEIYLVWVDGQPRLRVRRGDAATTVKLTPQMRIEPLDRAIPVISLEDIGPWLSDHRVVLPEDLEGAPYVIAGAKRKLLSSAGDELYGRGALPEGETGFGVYRQGQIFKDPESGEVLGMEATDIGSARLRRANEGEEGDISEFEVTRVTEEVRIGDRLLPPEAREIAATFQPRAPMNNVEGVMLAVDSGVSQIGTMDIVAVNLGLRDSIEEGHVLLIYQRGELVRDRMTNEMVQIPDTRAGLLMVFRSFLKMSYGIVLKSDRPLAVMDRVVAP